MKNEARLHVDNARPPQSAIRFAKRHLAQRAHGPDRVGMSQRQNFALLLRPGSENLTQQVPAELAARKLVCTAANGAISATRSTKRSTARGSSLGDSHSTIRRISAMISGCLALNVGGVESTALYNVHPSHNKPVTLR